MEPDTDPYSSAVSLYLKGQFVEALDVLEPLLQQHPPHSDALNFAAICLRKMNRHQEAESHLRRLIEISPAHVDAHCNLGNLLCALERLPEAETAYRQALTLQPHHAESHHNLGNLLCRLGRLTEAEAAYRRALALNPDHAGAQYSLGLLLYQLGRLPETEAAFQRTVELCPDYAEAHDNLGIALYQLQHLPEAEAAFRRAVALRPDYANAHYNLGVLLDESERLPEAEDAYRRVLALAPETADALHNLGSILMRAGLLDEGLELCREAVAYGDNSVAASQTHAELAYSLIFQAEDSQVMLDECRRWSARHEAPLRAQRQPHDNDRSPERRLRIGYVSPDFRSHCQSLFTLPVFAHHDHTPFEFFFYSSVATPDRLTERLKAMADVWRDVHALDDGQLAQLIREDRIDILVDLTMHMANGRPLVFARKPAPVQVAWLAYPGTTGIEAMDYRLTDPYIDPPGSDAQYSERSIRLPDTFWCYDPFSIGETPPVNSLPALAAGHLTFGSLNNPIKLTDHTWRLWAAVLHRVPGARLCLLAPKNNTTDRLMGRIVHHGIPPHQIEFTPFVPRLDYLRVYHQIDIGLDIFPCNGHTTSLDAFWMGVPVVTRVGNTAVGRGGLSLLTNLGLRELAAFSDEDYVETAVRLAEDLPRLAQLRQSLRSRMAQSPLMDGPKFARHMEAAYQLMWREWCAGTSSALVSG